MSGSPSGFRRIGEDVVHQGYIWRVTRAEFEAPDGERFTRDLVRSPGAVGVLPLMFDAEGSPSVVLVDQFRAPYEEIVREIPAGMRDIEGEDAEQVAFRELVEEAGLEAGTLTLLGSIYPSPGMTDSVTVLYLATDCALVDSNRQGPEEQHMQLVHVPLHEAVGMVLDGRIRDAKSVTAILLTERRLRIADATSR